ncbi:MAG: type II secretion system protein [Candidatus Omnitrophota bacterium]|nr:type II secretion system protein [Candidatus Omnitrophota bacterium]
MRQWLRHAFTLVELVIVIAIVGILAAIAIPRFIDIRTEAYDAQRDGIVGSVRAGILTTAAKNQVNQKAGTFPPDLEVTWNGITGGTLEADGTVCTTKACFELVIPGGYIDANWTQTTATTYSFDSPVFTGLPHDKTYTYSTANGTFN